MRIIQNVRRIASVMNLDTGDVFILNDYYYVVTGCNNYVDNSRECYNLSLNCVSQIKGSMTVEYWRGADIILKLSDEEY